MEGELICFLRPLERRTLLASLWVSWFASSYSQELLHLLELNSHLFHKFTGGPNIFKLFVSGVDVNGVHIFSIVATDSL